MVKIEWEVRIVVKENDVISLLEEINKLEALLLADESGLARLSNICPTLNQLRARLLETKERLYSYEIDLINS